MIWMASCDTRNYSFAAFGDTEKLAMKAIRCTWKKHARDCRAAMGAWNCMDMMTTEEFMEEIDIMQIPTYPSPTGKHVKPCGFIDRELYWEGK